MYTKNQPLKIALLVIERMTKDQIEWIGKSITPDMINELQFSDETQVCVSLK